VKESGERASISSQISRQPRQINLGQKPNRETNTWGENAWYISVSSGGFEAANSTRREQTKTIQKDEGVLFGSRRN